jgi:glycosyltransferase 2 family protein
VRLAARIVLKREAQVEIRSWGLLPVLLWFTASALIQGAAFFALVRSLYPVEFRLLPGIIGAYNGAWAAGFLSVIAPGGLGVREGALTMMLGPYITVPVAIISAAVARVWITLFEVAMALAGLRMKSTPATNETTRELS